MRGRSHLAEEGAAGRGTVESTTRPPPPGNGRFVAQVAAGWRSPDRIPKGFSCEQTTQTLPLTAAKKLFLKALGRPLARQAARLRGGSRRCSHLRGRSGIPEGWRPHRSGRRLRPPPGRGKSGETETAGMTGEEPSGPGEEGRDEGQHLPPPVSP